MFAMLQNGSCSTVCSYLLNCLFILAQLSENSWPTLHEKLANFAQIVGQLFPTSCPTFHNELPNFFSPLRNADKQGIPTHIQNKGVRAISTRTPQHLYEHFL